MAPFLENIATEAVLDHAWTCHDHTGLVILIIVQILQCLNESKFERVDA